MTRQRLSFSHFLLLGASLVVLGASSEAAMAQAADQGQTASRDTQASPTSSGAAPNARLIQRRVLHRPRPPARRQAHVKL